MSTVLVATSVATGRAAPAPAERVRAQVRIAALDTGSAQELLGVSFANDRIGYAVGVEGTILATSDGGATWSRQPAALPKRDDGIAETLTSVSFPDPLHGHAVTDNGTILATSDGGQTWTSQPPPPPSVVVGGRVINWSFSGVAFTDATNGHVIGGPAILSTSDGGASWRVFGEPRFGNLMGISDIDGMHSQAVGWSGHAQDGIPFVTVATADGGATWQPQFGQFKPEVDPLNFNAVAFTDPLHGHAVGDSGRIVATADGGQTWTLQRSGTVETLNGVAFADGHRGVAVGNVTLATGEQRALVFATDDGGLTWVSRIVSDTNRLWKVAFGGRETAYAVGCRSTRQDADATPHCLQNAVVKIDFLAPAAPSSDGSHTSWLVLGGGLGLVLIIASVLVVRRRSQ